MFRLLWAPISYLSSSKMSYYNIGKELAKLPIKKNRQSKSLQNLKLTNPSMRDRGREIEVVTNMINRYRVE